MIGESVEQSNRPAEMEDSVFEHLLPDVWRPLEQCISCHPKYHSIFSLAIDQLFYGNGPLPITERHYLALMAANQHKCSFLMDLHKREFERLGGDSNWLKGLAVAPTKIINLDYLNSILAHQPWSITANQLRNLTKCASSDIWSLTELLQGCVLLSHTHSLCSFVFGCGNIKPSRMTRQEIDDSLRFRPCSVSSADLDEVEDLMERMAELDRLAASGNDDITDEDKARLFNDMNRESSASQSWRHPGNSWLSPDSTNGVQKLSNSTGGPLSSSTDFLVGDSLFTLTSLPARCDTDSPPTLKIHDFSWEDQGFSYVDELYNEMSEHLDGKFHLTQELTYYTMGNHANVDTTKYRTATWMFIQSLFGIQHDDYDYTEVHAMLNGRMKTFIKTLCCCPERMTDRMRSRVMSGFKVSEKVHVILMILEARLQAQLLHLLRAVMRLSLPK